MQISETSSDERGVSERLGRGAGFDVAVDRLVWNAVCVVGRRLAGNNNKNNVEQVKLRSITFSYAAISHTHIESKLVVCILCIISYIDLTYRLSYFYIDLK